METARFHMNNAIYTETILHGTDFPHTGSQLRGIRRNSKRIVFYFPCALMCAVSDLVIRVLSAGKSDPIGQTGRLHLPLAVYRRTKDPATCSPLRHPGHRKTASDDGSAPVAAALIASGPRLLPTLYTIGRGRAEDRPGACSGPAVGSGTLSGRI